VTNSVTQKVPKTSTNVQFFLLFTIWFFSSFKPEWTIPGLKFIAPAQTVILSVLILFWLMYSKKKIDNPLTKYLILFFVFMTISSIFARNNGLSRELVQGIFFLTITYLVTITFANTEKRTFLIFNTFIFGNLLIALLGIKGGGLAQGIPIYEDQNDLALAMNILFPITLFLAIGEKSSITKYFYYMLTGIFLTTIVLSNSRGGFVGLVAVMFFVWFKTPVNRIKSTFIILTILIGMLAFAPSSFWEEMQTIEQGTQETTAASRIYLWQIAIREFMDHPLIGVGVNNYGVWLPDYVKPTDTLVDGNQITGFTRAYGRVCHSIYFTLLSELGIVGVILYSLSIYWFFKELRFVNKNLVLSPLINTEMSSKDKMLHRSIIKCNSLSLGLMAGMIGFLTSGAFITVLYYPQFWLLCSLGVALSNCSHNIIAKNNEYTEQNMKREIIKTI